MLAKKRVQRVCGKLAVGHRLEPGCLDIGGSGRILGVRENPEESGPLILPGLIDIHVHLRGLRLSYKEDELSGTLAAARGGLTLVADMPNTRPPLRSPEPVAEKLAALRERAVVEYRVYLGIPPPARLAEMMELAAGSTEIAGFKVYPEDFDPPLRTSLEKIVAKPGMLVVVHPELNPPGDYAEDGEARSSSRGCWLEVAAVEELAAMAPEARIHITHASCPETVDAARKHGFTVDTTPHHLFLDTAGCRHQCLCRVNPPLRQPATRIRLLEKLLEGLVDAVASDHAPHSPREKEGDPLLCPPGIPWLEHWPHLLYCLAASALSIGDYAALTSLNPAKILGVERCLEPGCKATLTLLEASHERVYAPEHSRAKRLPYQGLGVCSNTAATVVRGVAVYVSGRVEGLVFA